MPAVFNEAGFPAGAATYALYTSPGGESGSLVNGSWTGAMGELVSGRADMFWGSLSISSSRYNAVQFSAAFHQNTLSVLIRAPQSQATIWAFFLPFDPFVWLVLLATAFFAGLVNLAIDRLSVFGSYKSSDSGERQKSTVRESLLDSFSVMVGSSGLPTRSIAARIFSWFFAFFALIILATYTASLASFFVLSNAPPVLSSVEDLRRTGVPFAVVKGSNAASFFDQGWVFWSPFNLVFKFASL